MSYKIEWKESCVHIKYKGDIKLFDIIEVRGILSGDSRYDSINYVIADFLEVACLRLSKKDAKLLSTYHKTPLGWNPNIKLSIISDNNAIREPLIRYIHFMETNGWNIKLFSNFDELNEWCEN